MHKLILNNNARLVKRKLFQNTQRRINTVFSAFPPTSSIVRKKNNRYTAAYFWMLQCTHNTEHSIDNMIDLTQFDVYFCSNDQLNGRIFTLDVYKICMSYTVFLHFCTFISRSAHYRSILRVWVFWWNDLSWVEARLNLV